MADPGRNAVLVAEGPVLASPAPGRRAGLLPSALIHLGILALLLVGFGRAAMPPPAPPPAIALLLVAGHGAAGAAGGGGTARAAARALAPSPLPPAPAAAQRPDPAPAPRPPAAAPVKLAIAAASRPDRRFVLPPRKPAPPRVQPAAAAPAPPMPAPPLPQPAAAAAPVPAAARTAVAATGAGIGPGGPAGQGTGSAGAGRAALGDGDLAALGDDYLERLRRWLARYKRYPEDARARQEEGEVVVAFVLARDGTVLEAGIERSSGHPSLDRAALAMLRAASPVPPPPPQFRGERLPLALPVAYEIGLFGRLFD
jgi:protein TonB